MDGVQSFERSGEELQDWQRTDRLGQGADAVPCSTD